MGATVLSLLEETGELRINNFPVRSNGKNDVSYIQL
jgi:hypothetical protein